jgi:N-formylglutamate deformylase
MQPCVLRPPTAAALPVLVSIPHTGTHLPPEFAARLASDAMRTQPMTDWHLHLLYDFLPALGITTLHATWSRFLSDLNRAPEDRPLYPGRFETGLIPRQTFDGEAVWAEPPSDAEVARWRADWHAPYHARLVATLEDLRLRFGRVVLIDAHSVASRANRLHPALVEDIFLGDRDGATCGPWLMDLVAHACQAEGLAVARNRPYKGGYITDHYGRLPGVEALQIEMAQRVYMDEGDPAGGPGHPRFAAARTRLTAVFRALTDHLRNEVER